MFGRCHCHFRISIVSGDLALSIAALGVLDEQLSALGRDPCVLQPRPHAPPLFVLPPRQRGGSVHAESKDLGLVPPTRLGRHQGRVDLEEDVVEAGPEIRAVDGRVP